MTSYHLVDKFGDIAKSGGWRALRGSLSSMRRGRGAVNSCEIDYVCVASAHLASSSDGSDTLFHDGNWAYCHAGVQESHQWRRIPPTTIEELRHGRDVPEGGGADSSMGLIG